MKYTVYVLSSLAARKSYVGSTNNLIRRFDEHNRGRSYFTRQFRPWKIIYTEEFELENEAKKREKYLKSASGRNKVLKKLFDN